MLIELDRCSFRFNGHNILDSLSLSIGKGEFVSIIGPNGAGKTTLLKCLMKIYRHTEGRVLLLGRPLHEYRQKDLAKHIGYVPQVDAGFIPFTVAEYVLLGRYPYLSPFTSVRKADREAVEHALTLVGCSEFADRHMNTLSGGERQMAFIAGVLAQGAEILLLDEPATFLDPKHESDIYGILKRLHREHGMTLIHVTHNINTAALYSNRIVILKEGRIAFSGVTGDMMKNDVLAEVYGKEFIILEHPHTGQPYIAPEAAG